MATHSSSVIAFVIDYRGAFFSTGCRDFSRAVAEGAMKFGETARSPTIETLPFSRTRHRIAVALLDSGITFGWPMAVYGLVLPCDVVK